MNKKNYGTLLRIAGRFFFRHRTKVNNVLVFSPLVSIIPVLSYGVLHPEAEMNFFFWFFPFAIIIILCGVAKQHYEDLRDEKLFRDTLEKADEAILILRECHKRQDERQALLENMNTELEKMLDELYLDLITRPVPASLN